MELGSFVHTGIDTCRYGGLLQLPSFSPILSNVLLPPPPPQPPPQPPALLNIHNIL